MVAFPQEEAYLVERILCFGRIWHLFEDGCEICTSCASRQSQWLGSASRRTGQSTDASCSELEVPFARLAATKTRLKEPWIKDESAASTLLSGVISVEYLAHQGSTHAMKAKLTLLASAMLQPCSRGIWQWARGP